MMFEGHEKDLIELIKNYIACSKYWCRLLKDNFGIHDKTTLRARRMNLIPSKGALEELTFSFHGGGCYFEFEGGAIDVDFGPDDRHDGFDSQRLFDFIKSSKKDYSSFLSQEDIEKYLNLLFENKVIIKPNWYPNPHLYYLNI
ncbi:DUF6896 domain-containing protein [Polluticaenibacter yanchengensis]|uniref:DUF6896 domain-containing protein n=1 Tax=Polluticaenibacter yanchengensis TaxID=3014562 RepID=A0ABT4UF69_9BACT|nr:hypothetical protein [Chitinophagaceae bacterium LY-5]